MPNWFTMENEFLQRMLLALAATLVIFALVQAIKRLVARYVEDPERQFHSTRMVTRLGGLLALLFIAGILFESTKDLLTLLTVVGAGLAIALREALMSIFGWAFIAFRVPFRHGDRIEMGGIQGDVIDVRLFHTTMMEIGGWVHADQSTGRLVHVPNSMVFLQGLYNYTRGFRFIWNEMSFTLTFRSDWEAAQDIILSLASESAAIVEQQVREEIKKMSQEYLIFYNILTPFVYVRVVQNGVQLTLRYLCEARKRRGTEHALTVSILTAFRDHGGIELAYHMMGMAPFTSPQFGPLSQTSEGGSMPPPPSPL